MGLDIAKQSLNYVLRFGVSDTDGAATDADSTPYGRLLLDGTIDAATVNIIDDGIGDYYASGTIPANATIGSLAQLQVNAIVGSTSGAYTTIWQGRIVPDNIYDSFILGTDYLETELTNSSTSGIWQTNSRTLTGTKQTFDDLNDLSQTDILSDSTPFNGSNIDASISSRATSGNLTTILNKLPDSYIAGSSSSEGKVNLSDDENIYHCNVQVNFDDSQTRDEYTAFFYQNSTLTEASGMSITVMQRDGSSLIDGQSMTEIGSSNVYKYDTTSAAQRVPSGTSALVTISGLVSGNSNIFSTLIGRT